MRNCDHCGIVIDQGSEDTKKCGYDLGFICCNCAKDRNGWSHYEQRGCKHCKARAGIATQPSGPGSGPGKSGAAESQRMKETEQKCKQMLSEATRESSRLVEEAKMQASRLLEESRLKAKEESAKLLEQARREAERERGGGGVAGLALGGHADEAMTQAKIRGPMRSVINVFFHEELSEATQQFQSSNRVGGGGFGSVFKSSPLKGLGSVAEMAVKRLDTDSMQGQTEFLQELQVLGACKHENLLPLIGFSADENARGESQVCLVSPLMRGGSLEDRLHPEDPSAVRRRVLLGGSNTKWQPLSWAERLHICVCVARALEYLHTVDRAVHKPIIFHRDIKPANILLDCDMHGRLADVGLARMQKVSDATHVTLKQLAGTNGFIDPNYIQTGHFDASADGYALGVTMMMVLTGWPAFEGGETIIDRCFGRQALEIAEQSAGWPEQKAGQFFMVAMRLVQMPRRNRMSVAEGRALLEALEEETTTGLYEVVHEKECLMCMAMPRRTRFQCGHSAFCDGCLGLFTIRPKPRCPYCRQEVRAADDLAAAPRHLPPPSTSGSGPMPGGLGHGGQGMQGREQRPMYAARLVPKPVPRPPGS
mmetsp:Transcript_25360/g.60350  ORF Transcript_25360/g.60350 Transcript_25360/m.60350 type:complete len:594 (+) Transcript_25360:421-2202(+)